MLFSYEDYLCDLIGMILLRDRAARNGLEVAIGLYQIYSALPGHVPRLKADIGHA